MANSVSMAMLLVLETLTPAERAVFVLREVFDLEYDEIAGAVGKARPRSARSRTGRGHTSPPGGRTRSFPRPRPGTRSKRSGGRSKPVTCRACSTPSRPMSSS